MKKLNRTYILIPILIISLIAMFYFKIIPSPFAVTPSLGCQYIPNPDNPDYTKVLIGASSFTCNAQECIVSGSMSVSRPYGKDIVQCVSSNCVGPTTFDSLASCTSTSARCTSGTCSSQNCKIIQQQEYKAFFNFCPSSDPNFAYCSGSLNTIVSSTPITVYTEEKKILKGDSITFQPKNADNSDITDRIIRVKEYDCSCAPAVDSGNACSSGMIKCQPYQNICPIAYTFITATKDGEIICRYGPVGYKELKAGESICTNNVRTTCYYPNYSYSTYLSCDGTKKVGDSICGDYKTLGTCPSGQVCIVKSTGKVGEGVGYCGCAGDACILGYNSSTDSPNSYQTCIKSGNCAIKGPTVTCSGNKIFSEPFQRCICNPVLSCNPLESECVGTSIKSCVLKEGCYQWDTIASVCPGETQCYNRGNTLPDDICSCNGINECTEGQVRCTSPTTFLSCSKDRNNLISSCLKFRDLGGKTGIYEECVNNKIQQRTDIGCAYPNSPNYATEWACSTQKDASGILIEKCVNNECKITQDSNSAIESDLLRKRCSTTTQNIVQKVTKYTIKTANVYRWEDEKTCDAGLICNNGECTTTDKFVSIISDQQYGINEQINGIKVSLTNEVPNRANKYIIASLYDDLTLLQRVETQTDSLGKSTIDFNYAHPRKGTLRVEIIAGRPTEQTFSSSKEIEVSSTLDLIVVCPVQTYVNKLTECSWTVKNLDTGTIEPSVNFQIQLTSGKGELGYLPKGLNGLSFTPTEVGNVRLKIIASKEGLISDIISTDIPVEALTQNNAFEIDNKDFFSYSGAGITVGTRQLTIKVTDVTGQPEQVFAIPTFIVTPTGQEVPITFNKISEGVYRASYNFATAGTTYELKGNIQFVDVTKPSIPFSYSIVTASSESPITPPTNYWWIIAIVAGALIIIVTVFIIFKRKRKR